GFPLDAIAPAATAPPAEQPGAASPSMDHDRAVPPPQAESAGPQFRTERASRDAFIRKATLGRLRTAIDAAANGYDEATAPGFDLAWTPKRRMFGAVKGPRLLCRFVSRVDREAVTDAWAKATKSGTPEDVVCVILTG